MRTKEFKLQTWLSVFLAVGGTALLDLNGADAVAQNANLWLALMPLGFGTGVVLLSSTIKKFPGDADQITALKLTSAAICCNLWAASNGHSIQQVPMILQDEAAVKGILYTSLFTTAFAVWIQSRAFKRVSATDATIIFSSEPVWAATFAYFSLGEQLSQSEILGAILIISAGLSNEFNVADRIMAKFAPSTDKEV